MDITVLQEYMCVPIVVICLVIGYLIKHTVSNDIISNRWIPAVVTVLGVILGIWIEGAFTPMVLATGLVSGLASTGFHQLLKSFIDKEGDK